MKRPSKKLPPKSMDVDTLNEWFKDSAISHMGIIITEVSNDHMKASMPIDKRHVQSMGLLHGGVSCVLAETMGSALSNMIANQDGKISLGLEINANHIKGVPLGQSVTAECYFLQRSRSIHVTQIKIYNESNQLSCISRLTTILKPDPTL